MEPKGHQLKEVVHNNKVREDIVRGSRVPVSPKGHKWKEGVHNNKVRTL